MRNDHVIERLAAANPVPNTDYAPQSRDAAPRNRRRVLAAALVAAIAVPAAAFAVDRASLFGFSNGGSDVPTSASPFAEASELNAAMEELGFPATLKLLGQRNGISFYAARREGGVFCFAVDSGAGKAVGCDLTSTFPSPARPLIDFSRFSHGKRIAGFAADGVATVALLDASGARIASASVTDNMYASDGAPGAVAVEALDADGNSVYRRSFEEAP